MSRWKGDFEGFYNAGIRNAAEAVNETLPSAVKEFCAANAEITDADKRAIQAFASHLVGKLSEEQLKQKCPRYEYTSTRGYKYNG